MFEAYRARIKRNTVSQMHRDNAHNVVDWTFTNDPTYRRGYVVKVSHGLPKVSPVSEPFDIKFGVAFYQSIVTDEVPYALQFRTEDEKNHPEIAIGSYVYLPDDDEHWKWWLIVHCDERPQFRRWLVLECNFTFKWMYQNREYHCLGVQRAQSSFNSGAWNGSRNFIFVDDITSFWVPTNTDTLTIHHDTRFLISDPRLYPPLAWQVSKIENTTPIGLSKFKLTQEAFDAEHDNAERGVASYYSSPVTPMEPDEAPPEIRFSGTKRAIAVGGSKALDVDYEATWYALGIDDAVVDGSGTHCVVSIPKKYGYVGQVITVYAVGPAGEDADIALEVTE